MTAKELFTTARPMLAARTSGPFMLRGPSVAFSLEDDETGGGEQTEAAGASDDESEGGEGEDQTGEGGEDGQSGEDSEAAGEGESSLSGGEGSDELGEPKKRVPWQVKRIDKLTAEKAALAEEARVAKEETAALRALQAEGGASPTPASEDEINRRATAIAAANTLNDKVNSIYDAQLAKDPKLGDRIVQVRAAVGDQLQARPDFFEAITSIDNGGDVFNSLTKDIDHLSEILEMPPLAMGIELAKLAAKTAPRDATISRAGENRPPKPIESAAAGELALDDPKLPQAEFSRRRAAEREARRSGAS